METLHDIKLRNNKTQEKKLRAMNLLNSFSFSWEELRGLFKLAEIEKDLSSLYIRESNDELNKRDLTKIKNLEELANKILFEINRGRKANNKFKLVGCEDVRGYALKVYSVEDTNNTNNILFNIMTY